MVYRLTNTARGVLEKLNSRNVLPLRGLLPLVGVGVGFLRLQNSGFADLGLGLTDLKGVPPRFDMDLRV